jgi:NADPH-dependent ferric siderophore reductase
MAEDAPVRVRRPPPPFRTVTVLDTAPVGPRLRRLTLGGPALVGFAEPLPGASVRLVVPSSGADALEVPTWTGNEFLLGDGSRPALRTFTPLRVDPAAGTLDVEVVLHEHGVIARWAAAARPGDPCAVSGPGRGYALDPGAAAYLLAGDESAIPAIGQLLGRIPSEVPVTVHVEVAAPDGRVALPAHARAACTWHDLADPADPGSALVAAVRASPVGPDDRVWVAGEAASVQRIRRHLFDDLGFPRARATVRGYWKRGRSGDGDGAGDD